MKLHGKTRGGDKVTWWKRLLACSIIASVLGGGIYIAVPVANAATSKGTTTTTTAPATGSYNQPSTGSGSSGSSLALSSSTSPSPVTATQLGAVNNGACWPAYSFANANGAAGASNWLSTTGDGQVRAQQYSDFMSGYSSWFGYSGSTASAMASWVSGLHWVQLTSSVAVEDTYCDSGGVHVWEPQTLQAGEWVAENAAGNVVIRARCGNLLLPYTPPAKPTVVVRPAPVVQVVVNQPAPPAQVVTVICGNAVVGNGNTVNQGGNCNGSPPPPPPVCVQTLSPGPGYTWNQTTCSWTPPPPPTPVCTNGSSGPYPECPLPPPPCPCTTPIQVQIPVQDNNPGVNQGPTPGAPASEPTNTAPAPDNNRLTASQPAQPAPPSTATGSNSGASGGSSTPSGSATPVSTSGSSTPTGPTTVGDTTTSIPVNTDQGNAVTAGGATTTGITSGQPANSGMPTPAT